MVLLLSLALGQDVVAIESGRAQLFGRATSTEDCDLPGDQDRDGYEDAVDPDCWTEDQLRELPRDDIRWDGFSGLRRWTPGFVGTGSLDNTVIPRGDLFMVPLVVGKTELWFGGGGALAEGLLIASTDPGQVEEALATGEGVVAWAAQVQGKRQDVPHRVDVEIRETGLHVSLVPEDGTFDVVTIPEGRGLAVR
jgi:hypothetical protein